MEKKNGYDPNDYHRVTINQNTTNRLIKNAKRKYFDDLGHKLSNSNTGQKQFWNAFKRISNKKKTSVIPPISLNDAYISNFEQKANIFNKYFSDQCSVNENGSVLPELHLNIK